MLLFVCITETYVYLDICMLVNDLVIITVNFVKPWYKLFVLRTIVQVCEPKNCSLNLKIVVVLLH